MKKNKMLRMASVLMVMTLLTTSVIGGTFAKYVTSDSSSDTARVAKWGVTAIVSGDLFGADYVTGSNSDTAGIISATYTGSVDSSTDATGDKIVAPGTNADQGVTITISGTPEVENTVAFSSETTNNKDIYLKAGSYGTMVAVSGITADNFGAGTYYKLESGKYVVATTAAEATYELHDEVTLAVDYYPIVWTVTGTGVGDYTKVADMVTGLAAFNVVNNSLVSIDKTCNIKWKWAFEGNNKADTILGNIIAQDTDAVPVKAVEGGYSTLIANTDYCTEIAFNYTISVTQED